MTNQKWKMEKGKFSSGSADHFPFIISIFHLSFPAKARWCLRASLPVLTVGFHAILDHRKAHIEVVVEGDQICPLAFQNGSMSRVESGCAGGYERRHTNCFVNRYAEV